MKYGLMNDDEWVFNGLIPDLSEPGVNMIYDSIYEYI